MSCTVPWPFQKWFDSRFKDECDEHDTYYTMRIWKLKTFSDFLIAARFAKRGYYTLALLSIPYLAIFGTLYWWWKKWKR